MDAPEELTSSTTFSENETTTAPVYSPTPQHEETTTAPGYSPTQQHEETTTAPGYSPTQQHEETTTAPGYSPTQQHEETTTAPGYSPTRQHEETTIAPGYSPTQQHEETTTAPGYSPTQQIEEKNDVAGVVVAEKRWPGWPGENVYRMLVPVQKVGGIIGRKGELIKKMCEETKARIKILDAPPGTQERAVMVSAKEEPDASIPPAIDGLLRVHSRVVDGLNGDLAHAPPNSGLTVSSRLLVVATQAGNLIGKQGATIKSIQEASNTIVRVLGSEDLPVFALEDDRIVEVQGEPAGVHKAVELIAAHLRKFLVDRSVIGLFEMHMQMLNSQMEPNMPPHQSWGPHGFPPNAGPGPAFGVNPQYMPPPRQHDNYYPQHDHPPMDKQPHQGLSMYGREAPMGFHPSANVQPPPALMTPITHHMQIPLSFADAVIGNAGANISYIRRVSGAAITVQETRGVPGEMTVEINGSASQAQTAQQLIQACLISY
ncbi:hypothetical protein IFM89_024570 [Coptis chinensis]|uniref:K Homology domain-containing protein n=1 Tax=Coptis chinensis TaxID=261450 RepID=A0A835LX22_9MAGN|nr:hypothetical protein IFM89_024570 [Coptis chinensis]